MAPRPAWKGYLKLSLVTCAVELSNATTHSEKVSFRIMNRETGNSVKRRYIDGESGKPVDEDDQVKGYEVAKDEFLLIEEAEIEAVQIESSHTMTLDTFIKKAEIDPVYLDTPYYMTPGDKVSEEAFAVIREALAGRKMAGLARIVLYRRERPAVIEPFGKGMLLTTLHYGSTVRDADAVFDDIGDIKIDRDMVDLAVKVIGKRKTKFDPVKFEDPYENALRELIKSKKSGKKARIARAPAEKPPNVVNLFDALKKSLASEKSGGGDIADEKPAKKPTPKSKSGAKRKRA